MARKTFISYKYSEAIESRDKIIDALGKDAEYYSGETSDSPDMTDLKTDTIKEKLKNMIYGTTVTIVIISPNMKKSKWIDWEIKYSLKETKRKDRYSSSNGIVGVVQKVDGGYEWLKTKKNNSDGCDVITTSNDYLYDIIINNRFNEKPVVYSCEICKTVNYLTGSYISLINEDDFLKNPNKYIENAYEKSKALHKYNLVKE